MACVSTKLYYKCQMFLWWRLFSCFADSLKVLGSGIHFKLIESLLAVERRLCRCSLSLLKLINRHFSRKSHYNFVEAAGILHPKLCVLFPIFFFLVPLPLSYRREILYFLYNPFFRSSHCWCSVKKAVLKNFANLPENQLCWSLFLITLQGLRTVTLSKRDSNTSVFLWNLQNF